MSYRGPGWFPPSSSRDLLPFGLSKVEGALTLVVYIIYANKACAELQAHCVHTYIMCVRTYVWMYARMYIYMYVSSILCSPLALCIKCGFCTKIAKVLFSYVTGVES